MNLKPLLLGWYVFVCLACLAQAETYPPDLKQISVGDWKIERIGIQDAIARIVDAISTQTFNKTSSKPVITTPVRFTLEGWDEATSTSMRPNRYIAQIYNPQQRRFSVDTHGKNLEEVLDMITTGHGGYVWRYDADNGIVNVIEKHLAESPVWAFNQPLPDLLKGQEIAYAEIVKLFRKLKYGEFFLAGGIQVWEEGKLTPLLVPSGKKLETVRNLVNFCVAQKEEKDPGVYEIFFSSADVEPNLKELEQGTIPQWAIGWRYATSMQTVEENMRNINSVAERAKTGENLFAKWDERKGIRVGIWSVRDGAYSDEAITITDLSMPTTTSATTVVTPQPTPVVVKPAERKTNWTLHVGVVFGICLLGGIGFLFSRKK